MDAVAGFLVAARRFRDKLVEHHGEKGLEEFNAAPGFTIRFDDPNQDADDIEINIDGDQATAKWPGKARTVLLVRQEGEWKLSPPGRAEVSLVVEPLVRLAQVLEAHLKNIGDPAFSPASLSRLMGDQVGVQEGKIFADRTTPVR